MKTPKLVIIGRPNVGKSTLFNRLFGRRRALVHDLPGVTRDRLEERANWWMEAREYEIGLVDTGGVGGDVFSKEVDQQVNIALEEADIALMVFDAQSGLTPADEEVLLKLRRSGLLKAIPVIGIVNKVDIDSHEEKLSEFYATGLEPIVTISAEHGRGIDDLKLLVRELLPEWEAGSESRAKKPRLKDRTDEDDAADEAKELRETPVPRIAIVGRPNVGKSTMVNTLLGANRMITSPIAGTTVDAVDSAVEMNEHPFILIDTAGIRRKSKTEQGVEVLSVLQARKALERCDVAILLLDGEIGTSEQDEKIGGLIEEVGCGVILAINKWDTQAGKKAFGQKEATARVRKKFGFLKYAPIIFLSALEGEGFEHLGDLILDILEQRKVKLHTKEFTEWVRREAEIHNPLNAKFFMCHQSGRHPPTFVCHVNDPDKVHFSLRRHLVNALRERWGFMGSPVRMNFVQSGPTK